VEKSFKHRNLALLLLQARECVMGNFRRILNHHGLTEQQWRVIRTISDFNEPMEQWQICETCQILSPSLAGVLLRMEDMQLVDRTRVDTDQRRILVALTAKSRTLIKNIAPLIEQQYAYLEAGIGADAVAGLYAALDRFLEQQNNEVEQVTLTAASKKPVAKKSVKSVKPTTAAEKKSSTTARKKTRVA